MPVPHRPLRHRSPAACSRGVLAHRLQQPVARCAVARLGQHQRLVHQRVSRSSTPSPSIAVAGADRLGRLERPAPGEDRQPPEQRALRLAEQVVAPVDQRAQRLLARQGRPAAAGQQPEAVVQPGGDLLDRQRAARAPPPARCASGMPSSRRQTRPPPARSASVRAKPAARARRAPRTAAPPRTGADCRDGRRLSRSGSDSEGTRQGSPGDAQRLAAGGQHRTCGQARSRASASSAQASSRCSQLSSRSSACRLQVLGERLCVGCARRPPSGPASWPASAGRARIGDRRGQLDAARPVGEVRSQLARSPAAAPRRVLPHPPLRSA